MRAGETHGTRHPKVSAWDQLEQRYRENLYDGIGDPGQIDEALADRPIVIVAAHSLNHFRDGKVKFADRWTGSMAEIVATESRSGYIVPVGKIPNWDFWPNRTDEFKLAIDKRAVTNTLFIDLHGMSDKHGIDLCIGMGPAPGLAAQHFAALLQKSMSDYTVTVNKPYAAMPSYTLTSYVQLSTNADAIQLEIAARLRNPQDPESQSEVFLQRFAAFARDFNSERDIR